MTRAQALTPDASRYRSVLDLMRGHAERTPDKIFLRSIDQGSDITWDALYRLSNRIAAFLTARGVGAGDRVAVLSENSLETLILYFGILRHGATFCTVNVEVNATHLGEMLDRLQPKLVLWNEDLDGAALAADRPGEWIGFGALFSEIETLPETPVLPCLAGPDDIAVISFTSGTSAAPKGVMHQFGNYFWIADHVIDAWGLTGDDRVLEIRSFSWASSHMLCLMPCLVSGAEVVFARRFSNSRFFDWLRDHRPTVAIAVPTVVNMLLERADDADTEAFKSVRFMSCSTAPLMIERHRRFEETYGIKLVQLYGMSEGGVVAANHHDARRIGSVGPPGKYQDLRVLDESGHALPAGEIGEIETGGAQTAFGYLLEDRTIERIRDTRLKSGDLGYFDTDGYLHVTGRAKDVIIRGGVNIAPLEIDNALTAHPDIAEAATIGVPDAVYGEEVVSYVAPRRGSGLDERAVLAHCTETLPEFKRPRRVILTDAIPKNARGKIDRGAIGEAWRKRAAD